MRFLCFQFSYKKASNRGLKNEKREGVWGPIYTYHFPLLWAENGQNCPKNAFFCVFSFHIKKHQIGVPKMKNGKVYRGPIAPTCFPLIWAGKWPKLPKNAFFVFSVFI